MVIVSINTKASATKKKTSKKKTSKSTSKKKTAKKKIKILKIKHDGPVWGIKPSGLKRIALVYGDEVYNFRINPKQYDYERATRYTAYKTQNSNVVQMYGADLAEIKFNGTTGWHPDSSGKNGEKRLNALNELMAKYQNDTQNGGVAQELKFNNYTDHKYYKVVGGKFSYHRDFMEPLLFDYSLELVVIGGSDTPEQDSSLTAVVGTGSGSSVTKGKDADNTLSSSDQHLVDTVTNPHATKQDIDKATKKLKKKHGN